MPKETENYKFKKPLYSDNADVAVLNENFDEIDKAFTPSLSASDEPGVQNNNRKAEFSGDVHFILRQTSLALVSGRAFKFNIGS